jgi:uncharacterized protein (DUF486 family)
MYHASFASKHKGSVTRFLARNDVEASHVEVYTMQQKNAMNICSTLLIFALFMVGYVLGDNKSTWNCWCIQVLLCETVQVKLRATLP